MIRSKNMIRIMACLLAAVLLPAACPVSFASALAAVEDGTTYEENGITYMFQGGAAIVTACDPAITTTTIPERVNGVRVRAIQEKAFADCTALQTVELPDGLVQIDDQAFFGCTALENVTLPDTLTTIGGAIFNNCIKLANIKLPDNVTSIGARVCLGTAFAENNDNWVDNLLYIGQYLVMSKEAELQGTIDIRPGTTTIAAYTFNKAKNMTAVHLPPSVARIGYGAFFGCSGLQSICIPDNVTEIKEGAFFNCTALFNVTLPQNLQIIGAGAFQQCDRLTKIVVPDSVLVIRDGALYCCDEMRSITLPDRVMRIGRIAFEGTAFYNDADSWAVDGLLYCGAHLLRKKDGPFCDYVIREGTKSIADQAFADSQGVHHLVLNHMYGISIPLSMGLIGKGAFSQYDNIDIVLYPGSEKDWDAIQIMDGNDLFSDKNVTLRFRCGQYPDVPNNIWYTDAVKYVSIRGYMSGYANGKFGAGDKLQRQDFVIVLCHIAGGDHIHYSNRNLPSDAAPSSYYEQAVLWGYNTRIISGYANGKFGVGDPITREQVCTILYRYKGSPAVGNVDQTLKTFQDASRVSDWAKPAVAWAIQNKVISGMADGRIAPNEYASRAQIAVIIANMDQNGLLSK